MLLIASLPAIVLAELDLWEGAPAAAHERIGPLRESLVPHGYEFIGSFTLPL